MNSGALALQRVLEGRGGQQRLSEKLKVSPGVVSSWVNGNRCPHAKYRIKLQKLLGIPWHAWDDKLPEAGNAEPDPPPPDADAAEVAS
jgi:ribosome-binding protein aMBF1 (putative translation factor)